MSMLTRGLKKGSIIARVSKAKCQSCKGTGEQNMGTVTLKGFDAMPDLLSDCWDCKGTGICESIVRVFKRSRDEKAYPAT